MYKGYNLKLEKNEPQAFLNVTDRDLEEYEKEMDGLKENLKNKLNKEITLSNDDNLDGSKIINDWFPNYKADIFISHSHNDIRTAKRLACWLKKEFGLTAFIDSTVWGNNNDLLRIIDNKYAKKPNDLYDYNIRNFTTSHVHMMLATALNDVIYSSECLIFLNTPQSLSVTEVKNEQTNSPWIYNELKTTATIYRKAPERNDNGSGKEFTIRNQKDPSQKFIIKYDVDKEIGKLHDLNVDKLQEWQLKYKNCPYVHPLDILYIL